MIKLADVNMGEEELREIEDVFKSGHLVQGKKVEEFENMIKTYLNVKHAVAVSSGTAALHLSLLTLGIGEGDEIIVPDFTFPATANVVEVVGADLKLVDIELDSFCIDVNKIEKYINEKTKAIIPVQEFGQSCNMDKIMELAKKYNLKVIEDAACALGAEYNSKKVGTIGDIGCFSLHPRKSITTGEGGIIVTNDDGIADKVRVLRNHGMSSVNGEIKFIDPGLNYRMTDIQGAIGIVQMKKIEQINIKKVMLAHKYNDLLKGVKNIIIPEEQQFNNHIWQTYHILIDKDIDRNIVINELRKNNIEANLGAYAVHFQPYYKDKYNLNHIEYENSMFAYEKGIALPLHFNLEEQDIIFIVDTLKTILR